MRPHSRQGFTLIELLTVIAIITVLAAILFPVFALSRDRARSTACLSNMKQIGNGVLMYLQDNDEQLFPYTSTKGGSRTGVKMAAADAVKLKWWNVLDPYVRDYRVYSCPSDPTDLGRASTPASLKSSTDLQGTPFVRSYIACRSAEALTLGQIDDPVETIVITEKWDANSAGPVGDSWIESFNGDFDDDNGTGGDPHRLFKAGNRHQGLVNCMMFDGHAKALTAETIQESKDLTGCNLIYHYPVPKDCPPLSGSCTMGVKTVSSAPGEPNICDPTYSPSFHYQ